MKRSKIIISVISLVFSFMASPVYAGETYDKLALQGYLLSWNEGLAKERIVAFVESASDPANKNFVPQEQRRAFFDMDGTLLCEKPDYIEVAVTKQRLKEKALADPSLAQKGVYKAASDNDDAYLYKHVKEAIAEAFGGETLRFFITYCRNFLHTQKHPRFQRSYVELFYVPMLELTDYLRGHGFRIYVVSTSQQEFIRSIARDVLKIPNEQVIGTMIGFELQNMDKDEPPVFVRKENYFSPYNADEEKVVRMRERGVMPSVFAFGNSGGDLAMLDATADSGLPGLVCILDHDDPDREYEYHKKKLLKVAQERNWNVVSMKNDFRVVFRAHQ